MAKKSLSLFTSVKKDILKRKKRMVKKVKDYKKIFLPVVLVVLLVGVVGLGFYAQDFFSSESSLQKSSGNLLTGAVNGLAEELGTEANVEVFQTIANCWDADHSASKSGCEDEDAECQWHEDPWGSWCEQKGCWNFYEETACGESNTAASDNYINKSCSWSGSSSGWCMQMDCWALDGTNENACEVEAYANYSLNCTWSVDTDHHPCMGPPEKGCWQQTTEATCTNITGCGWGMCMQQSCWDQTTASGCTSATGYGGNSCNWNAQYSYCYESGCWDYQNKTACETASCTWDGGSCFEAWCSDYSNTDQESCENNNNSLSCSWSDPWCEEKGCWSHTNGDECAVNNSSSGTPCFWETYSGGWCEEVGCWNWDGMNDANESDCISNATYYGLSCVWQNDTSNDNNGSNTGEPGWCYESMASKSCGDISYERDCIDTMYCFWNYSGSGACQDPETGFETDFIDWYPGCWIFDQAGSAACGSTTNCTWVSGDYNPCRGDTEDINSSDPTIGGLRCEYINDSGICNNMTMLPHCCEWQAGTCNESTFSTTCWDQMAEFPEGAAFCEDYNAYTDKTLCEQIAAGPWYMPCKWDNMSTTDLADDRCTFKMDQVFETGKENVIYLDSQKTCESAGGKWVVDMYASSSDPDAAVALPMGHCEDDFEGKRNCNTDCYACDYKADKTNHTTEQKAEAACYGSLLGMCSFANDSSAPNGFGYCKQKEEFKKGIAKDCDEDCGSCTYMGSATSAEADNRPSTYCRNSKVTGGCKWIPDLDYADDESKGRCAKKIEKTCEDRCDLCNEETHCTNYGKKKGNTSMDAQCSWSDTTNTCSLTTGGAQMEICWDGEDNNNDGKMDCADGQCWSDPFCGGGFMAGFGGMDCFGYDTSTTCTAAGCAWVSENWGSWCDMPGAQCWSNDGDETACGLDGNCTWHSGFGGFCEENWSMMGSSSSGCMSYGESDCQANESMDTGNCTWIIDSYYTDMGDTGTGWCESNPSYDWSTGSGDWMDCASYSNLGETSNTTCAEAGSTDGSGRWPCQWMTSGGGGGGAAGDAAGSYSGGWCEHMNYGCHQFMTQSDCEEQTNATYNHSVFCFWKTDDWGSYCEGKKMGGMDSTDSCWNQNTETDCNASNCNWVSGFCDPAGFGSNMGFGGMAGGFGFGGDGGETNVTFGGMGGGASFTSMGGTGMTCMKYDGNKTGCDNTSGCGWMTEQNPFCDVDFTDHCPEFSYSQSICNSKSRCVYDSNNNFCDEKPFSCFWNQSFNNSAAGIIACEATGFCRWTDWGSCEPLCFNTSLNSETVCNNGTVTNGTHSANQSFCRWVNGWCSPGMAAKFFGEMEGGAPISLGTDAVNTSIPPEVDIVDFGMKDMGPAFGFGITVDNVENSSLCNGVKLTGNVTGTGYNASKFYWYLDTNGTSTKGCTTKDSNNLSGFEFYLKGEWVWGSSDVTETLEAYRCNGSDWKKAPMPLSSVPQKACRETSGGMVAVEKAELEKYPELYTTGEDIRVYVATANVSGNITNPTDTSAEVGYGSPGSFDQDLDKLDLYAFKNASQKIGEGVSKGYIEYADVDCWTEAGCADYQCKDHAYCVNQSYGVEAAGFTDTRVPKIVGLVKETYYDSAIIKFWTDKPSNASLEYFGPSADCPTTLGGPGYVTIYSTNNQTTVRNHTLEHIIEITAENMGGSLAADGVTGYYKLTFCDNDSKCGISKCSSIVYETADQKGAFDNFVTKIEAPSGWNVSYDLDRDSNLKNRSYEFDQNAFIATTNKTLGMKTNFSDGRRVNIKLATADNSSWIEFIDAKLTKTGIGSSTVRKVDDTGDMMNGTTTDVSGNTVGYVGMIEETRDQIVNNLFPERCMVKFPNGTTGCTELWQCNDEDTVCLNRTGAATLNDSGDDYCIWELPYCEFSNWGGGDTGSTSSTSSTSTSSGGGGVVTGGGGGGDDAITAAAVEEEEEAKEKVAEEEKVEAKEPAVTKAKKIAEAIAAKLSFGERIKNWLSGLKGTGGIFEGTGEVLVNFSWLWITIVIIGVGAGIGVYLYRTGRNKQQ